MNADEVVWFDLVTDEEYPDSEVSISKRSPSRRMHGQTFRFSGSSVVVGPQDSRAGGFCPEQVGKSYLFGKIRPARSVVRGIPQRGGCEVVVPQRWIRRANHAPAWLFVSSRASCIRMARAVGPRMNVNTVAITKSDPPATMVLIAPNAGTAHPVMRYPTIPAREKTTPMKL